MSDCFNFVSGIRLRLHQRNSDLAQNLDLNWDLNWDLGLREKLQR